MKLWQKVIVWAILGVMAFVAWEAFKAISTRIRDSVNGGWGITVSLRNRGIASAA